MDDEEDIVVGEFEPVNEEEYLELDFILRQHKPKESEGKSDKSATIENDQQKKPVDPVDPGAKVTARIGVDLVANGAEGVWEVLSFDEPVRDKSADVMAPVLQKYNINFGTFDAEIKAGLFFGGVIAGSIIEVGRHNRAERKKEKEKEERENGVING